MKVGLHILVSLLVRALELRVALSGIVVASDVSTHVVDDNSRVSFLSSLKIVALA